MGDFLDSNDKYAWSQALMGSNSSTAANSANASTGTLTSPNWLSQLSGASVINDPNNMTWSQALFGGVTSDGKAISGIGNDLLGLANSGLNAYTSLGNLNLAQDSLNFQKSAWQQNFDNAVSSYNTELRDRQQARVDRNSNAQSVADYMAANGL